MERDPPEGQTIDGEVLKEHAGEALTLREALADFGCREAFMETRSVLRLLDQLLEALRTVHLTGAGHGSLGLDNILLIGTGSPGFKVKITGFELARIHRPSRDSAAEGRSSGPSRDLAVVGRIALGLLTGRLTDSGDFMTTPLPDTEVGAFVEGVVGDLAVPASFRAFFRKALSPEPDTQFRDADEFAARMEAMFADMERDGKAAQGRSVGTGRRTPTAEQRLWLVLPGPPAARQEPRASSRPEPDAAPAGTPRIASPPASRGRDGSPAARGLASHPVAMPEPPVRLPDVARQVPRQAEEDPHETDVPEVPHPSMWFLALPIAFVAIGILMGVAFMTAGGDDEADAQPAVMAELPEGDLPSGPELVRVMELKELFRDAGQRVVPDSRGFEKTENCENNIDDDGDGLVDCSDPACAGTVDCAGHGGVGTGEIEGVD